MTMMTREGVNGLGQVESKPFETSAPWRIPMKPPGVDTYFQDRGTPTGGEVVTRSTWGPKPYTMRNDERNFPREGNVSFDAERENKMSYRTRGETYKWEPYWDSKGVVGEPMWPAKQLFPYDPTIDEVDAKEHDILPTDTVGGGRGSASVTDLSGYMGGTMEAWGMPSSTTSSPGIVTYSDLEKQMSTETPEAKKTITDSASQAIVDTKTPATAEVIAAATKYAMDSFKQYQEIQLEQAKAEQAKYLAQAGGGAMRAVTKLPSKPFYENPIFLIGAGLAVLGGGYFLLRKK